MNAAQYSAYFQFNNINSYHWFLKVDRFICELLQVFKLYHSHLEILFYKHHIRNEKWRVPLDSIKSNKKQLNVINGTDDEYHYQFIKLAQSFGLLSPSSVTKIYYKMQLTNRNLQKKINVINFGLVEINQSFVGQKKKLEKRASS